MKVRISHGTGTKFEIEVEDGATVETVLKNATVVTICGEQGAARLNTTEVPIGTEVYKDDLIEPITVANEKAL